MCSHQRHPLVTDTCAAGQMQLEASQQAALELQRLQAESQAKRQEVASLEAGRDAQAAALAELARQRDEEAARRSAKGRPCLR